MIDYDRFMENPNKCDMIDKKNKKHTFFILYKVRSVQLRPKYDVIH